MANQTLSNVTILIRNDTASNWTTENPVLSKGEFGVEIDTKKFKIGDGIKTWSQLSYVGTTVASSSTNGHISVDGTDTTVYMLPIATSTLGGVITTASGAGTVAVDSSTGGMALNSSGVTAGTYEKVTVDAHGVVTSGANLSASDIPNLTLSKITDAGTAAAANTGTSSGNVPILDSNGKLNTSVLPPLAINNRVTVADDTARYALTTSSVQNGDVVLVTGTNKSYFVVDDTNLDSASGYTEILTPAATVQSVNGYTGTVSLASTDLTDTSNLLRNTDTLTLDCGAADRS